MSSSLLTRALVLGVLFVFAGAPSFAIEVERLPYHGTPVEIPGRIEAEEYDRGAAGTVYYDTTPGNSGGAFRDDDVDIGPAEDTGGGFHVGWIEAGEWLEYTVNCETGGLYMVRCRVATANAGGTMHLEIGGNTISSSITFGSTEGWQNWITYGAAFASIPQGESRLRLVFGESHFNVNWIEFEPVGSCPPLVKEGHDTDSDGDGFSDDIENFYGSDAFDGGSKPRFGDLNGDGVTNLLDALIMARQSAWPQGSVDCHADIRLQGSVGVKGALVLKDWALGGREYPIIPGIDQDELTELAESYEADAAGSGGE